MINLIEVANEFATEADCLEFLAKRRCPDGVRCPRCGNSRVTKVTRKSSGDNKRPFTYACSRAGCKHRFSPTAGTVFHGSHLPLRAWFLAIALVMDAKQGISASQIKSQLGIGSYRTAWYMVHRIRKALAYRLGTRRSGVAGVDEMVDRQRALAPSVQADGRPMKERHDGASGWWASASTLSPKEERERQGSA